MLNKKRTVRSSMAIEKDGTNGVDEAYPYLFEGRLWFRPAIVRVPEQLPPSVQSINLFGYSIGGVVSLEYDESPVGPYYEYVTMGSLVYKRGFLGQWGSRLFVSTQPAEEVCRRIWEVPAEQAEISFVDGGALRVQAAPPLETDQGVTPISVQGWQRTRSSHGDAKRVGALPILWTPTIKALWAPFSVTLELPQPSSTAQQATALPLHKLRLSASSLRLQWCPQMPSDLLGTPLPLGLSVDGVRIEIGPELKEKRL